MLHIAGPFDTFPSVSRFPTLSWPRTRVYMYIEIELASDTRTDTHPEVLEEYCLYGGLGKILNVIEVIFFFYPRSPPTHYGSERIKNFFHAPEFEYKYWKAPGMCTEHVRK